MSLNDPKGWLLFAQIVHKYKQSEHQETDSSISNEHDIKSINCPFNVKELEAQANKKKRMMSNTNESPRPRTPSPRTTAQSISIQEETLSTSDYTTPTPIRSMILAQLYHSSRRSRHDSPQHKTSDVISISSINPLPPLFELSACNDQEKIWKEMEIAISNTNADEWSFCLSGVLQFVRNCQRLLDYYSVLH